MKNIKTLALFAVLAASALAYADDTKMKPDMSDKAKSAKLTDAEQKVISHQHAVNTMEIDAAQFAQKNAKAPAVKSYAKMVINDHQKLDRDLASFAKQHGINKIAKETPTSDEEKRMHDDQMAAMAKLKKMKGADVDRTFLQMMVTNHENELSKLDDTVASIQDPDLKQMVEDTRPILQSHADKAKELEKQTEQTSSIKGEDRDMNQRDKNQNQPVAP